MDLVASYIYSIPNLVTTSVILRHHLWNVLGHVNTTQTCVHMCTHRLAAITPLRRYRYVRKIHQNLQENTEPPILGGVRAYFNVGHRFAFFYNERNEPKYPNAYDSAVELVQEHLLCSSGAQDTQNLAT